MASIEPMHEIESFQSTGRGVEREASANARRERPSIDRSVLAVLPVLVVAQLVWLGLLIAGVAYLFGVI